MELKNALQHARLLHNSGATELQIPESVYPIMLPLMCCCFIELKTSARSTNYDQAAKNRKTILLEQPEWDERREARVLTVNGEAAHNWNRW